MLYAVRPGIPQIISYHFAAVCVGVELHLHPDLLLDFGELIRRGDARHPIPPGLPRRVHLLNQHFQLRLTLLPWVGVDAFGLLGAVRPGGGE